VIIGKKIEPMNSYWICSVVLSKRNKNRQMTGNLNIMQTYEFIKNPLDFIDDKTVLETNYNETCDALDSIVLNSSSYIEGMAIMKVDENYVYRLFDNNSGFFTDFSMPLVPVKSKFLSVVYKHAFMDKSIFIELSNNLYFVNNQILSPSFVKFYLEHQSESYFFDMYYSLEIMDNDLTVFTIGFNKSILLLENDYRII